MVKKVKRVDTKHQEDAKKGEPAQSMSRKSYLSHAAPTTSNADDLDNPAVKDDDPEGLKLLAVADPLESAWKRLLPLHTHRPKLLDTWLVSFDVAMRQSMFLTCV